MIAPKNGGRSQQPSGGLYIYAVTFSRTLPSNLKIDIPDFGSTVPLKPFPLLGTNIRALVPFPLSPRARVFVATLLMKVSLILVEVANQVDQTQLQIVFSGRFEAAVAYVFMAFMTSRD